MDSLRLRFGLFALNAGTHLWVFVGWCVALCCWV